MKTYPLIGLLLLSLGWYSCDFLEVEPQGKEASTTYMTVEENAENAVTALYNLLRVTSGTGPDGNYMWHHFEFFFGSIASDDAEKGSTASDLADLSLISNYTMTPSNTLVRAYYIHGFWGISRANYVLEHLQSAPLDERLKARMTGEAHFFRAYYYFYLLRHFGGMPIFRQPLQLEDFGKIARSSITETFDFIEEEFQEAIRLLPEKNDYDISDQGRATRGAAQAFLARVMMYRLGIDPNNTQTTWQHVYDLTSQIISGGQYDLLPNYAELFEEETRNCIESIFEIQAKSGTGGVTLPDWNVQANRVSNPGANNGWGFHNPTQDLVDAFDPTDPRLSSTVYGIDFNENTLYGVTLKFNRSQQQTNYFSRKAALSYKPSDGTSKQWMLMRYADVLLMHAEAAFRLGKEDEARNMVNKIRDRARNSSYCKGYELGKPSEYVYPSSTPTLPACQESGDKLYEAILYERRVELALEGYRTWDLIRTGRLPDRLEQVKDFARDPGHASYNTKNDANLEPRVAGIRQHIQQSSLIGKDGKYIPVMPLPETEVNYWNLEANPF